jgi:hypothetical protein
MIRYGWVRWSWIGLVVSTQLASCGKDSGHGAAQLDAPGGNGGDGAGLAGQTSSAGAELRGQRDGLPLLGQKCQRDLDCGVDGLRCLSDNEDYLDDRGAPPGGICTADCTTDAGCRSFDPSAVCATLAEAPLVLEFAKKPVARLCMLGCKLGAPSGDVKCHGRTDLACRPFGPEPTQSCLNGETCPDGSFCFRGACREAACGPRCNADADCGAERHCNPLSGLCDRQAAEAVPLGTACLGELDTTPVCGAGNCLDVYASIDSGMGPKPTRVKEICTQSCTLGSVCGEGAGACVSPRTDNFAPGDAAYCLQKCDCDADCSNPADRCLPWDAETAKHYGSQGVCDYAPSGAKSLQCAGGASAGGAGGSPG